MKTRIFTLLFLLVSISVFAQGPWFTTGNAIGPGNFLGTTNNQPLRFQTNGIQRIHINPGGAGVNAGFVGIGNNFTSPQNRLHLFQTTGAFGVQFGNNFSGATATDGFAMNLTTSGIFTFTQYENRNVQTTFERKFHHATYVKSYSLPCSFVL